MSPKKRVIFLFFFLICTSAIGYALYLQVVVGLLPCPLCIAQRIAYWLIGLTALIAFIHNSEKSAAAVYCSFITFFSLVGFLFALRHSWLIRYTESFECGISTEEKFLNAIPLSNWWPTMFEANGDCTDIKWEFASLTIPDWSAILFVCFFTTMVYLFITGSKNQI